MAQEYRPFWRLDFGKLTLAGWLLMLLAIVAVFAVSLAMIGLFSLVGLGDDPVRSWPKTLAVVLGIIGGFLFFEGGRNLLEKLGIELERN